MADPNIRIKRSSVEGKRPSISQVEMGELALNTNDGRLFTRKYNVGIGSTVTLLNPWTENIGGGTYYKDGNVGIGTTNPITPLHISDGNGGISIALYTTDYLTITAQNTAPGFNIIAAGSAVGHRGVFKATRARGTLSSPSVPLADDNTFSLLGAIYDGSGNFATAAINMDVDGTVGVGTAPQRITFWTGTGSSRLERARITSTGNIGIGTTNPTSLLQVQGNALITGIATVNSNFSVNGNTLYVDAINNRIGILTTAPIQPLQVNSDSSSFVVTGIGSVGIGTTNPTSSLTIYKSNGGSYANTGTHLNIENPNTTSGQSVVGFTFGGTAKSNIRADYVGNLVFNSSSNFYYWNLELGASSFIFASSAGTWLSVTSGNKVGIATNNAVQPLHVQGNAYVSGNLGIGTTNPAYTLDVVGAGARIGTANTTVIVGGNSGRAIEIGAGTSTLSCFIDFHGADDVYSDYASRIDRASGANSNFSIINRGTGSLSLFTQDAGSIDFYTNNTFRHRIDSNGTFLVGTSSSTGTASQLLQVNSGAYINGNLGIGTTNPLARLSVGSKSLGDGLVPVQISTQSASGSSAQIYYGANNNGSYGVLFGYDRAAYTGGVVRVVGASDNIEFVVNNTTRAAIITSAANIGIGTTIPSEKLEVVGNIKADNFFKGTTPLITGVGISSNSTRVSTAITDFNFIGAQVTAGLTTATVTIVKVLTIGRRDTTAATINAVGAGITVLLRSGSVATLTF